MAKPKVTDDGIKKLGMDMQRKRDQYMADRAAVEEQWLKNLRQYRGKYDPDIERLIPDDKSKAYPRDTRVKIKGFVAKMMEMMFPASEQNWDLTVSPLPAIERTDLEAIISMLQAQELQVAIAEQRDPQPLTSEQIEQAVKAFAETRKDAMQQQIADQLADTDVDWPQLVKRVIRSGAIYGFGVVKAPLVRKQTERLWQPNAQGVYEAVQKTVHRPYPEFIKVWDIYPDMSASTWEEQEGLWERMVFTRADFRRLGDRPGFKRDVIDAYLRDHQTGNYVERSHETALNTLNQTANPGALKSERKYEVFRWFGFLSGYQLRQAGLDITEEQLNTDQLVDVWVIDDQVIFADFAPFGKRVSDVYHVYIYAEDEDAGLTGTGLPEEVRDTQMGRCAAKRALYDNMAATAGPMLEVAVDLLKRNANYKSIHSFKVFEREGDDNTLQYPAVRPITHPSHIPQIMEILQADQEQLDIESNIPSWMLGNAQPLGEAFRTSSNMSMMYGSANMVTKDHTRAFDRFIASVIKAFLDWNMEFNPDPNIKGDFQVRARGNISLVAKEVRGAALDQFMMGLTPEERQLLKTREVMIERLKARDLPLDLVVSPEEAEAQRQRLEQMQAQAAQAQAQASQAQAAMDGAKTQKLQAEAQEKMMTINAKVAQAMAQVEALQAKARATRDKAELETLNVMLQQLSAAAQEGGTPYVRS